MALKVKLGNYQLTYCLTGQSSNPAILFLHGFMGDRHEFQQAIATLSKRFYCVTLDLMGHGQTKVIGIDQEYHHRIEQTAVIIAKFLDFLHLDRCFLVGYSMGGRLGLYLILHFPDYFYRGVLESASAGLAEAKARLDRLAKDEQLANTLEAILPKTLDFQNFLENWYHQPIFDSLRSHPDFLSMIAQRLHNSPHKLARSLRNMSLGRQPSLWHKLPDNKIPLLLMAGQLDPKFVQINRQMQLACPVAKFVAIANCGHNIHFENPDLFAQHLQAFFHS